MSNPMESLLKWSINASQNGAEAGAPDPKLMSQLFGAPGDAALMREELKAAVEDNDKEVKLACLEQFQEHVENVDNANNIGKLWEPLLYLSASVEDDISAAAIACIAAAVQNNEKSQADLVATQSGIPLLVQKLDSTDPKVLSATLLAISSAIAHCQAAYDQFSASQGWEKYNSVFCKSFEIEQDTSEKVKGRVLSLLYSIVLFLPQKRIYDQLETYNLIPKLAPLESRETGVSKEKIGHILATVRENPKQESKALALAP